MRWLSDQDLWICSREVEHILRAVNPRDPIKPIILRVSKAITQAFLPRRDPAADAAEAIFARGHGAPTAADMERALKAARVEAGREWLNEAEPAVRLGMQDAYEVGRRETLRPLRIKPRFDLPDELAADWLRRDTMYWVGDCWQGGWGQQIAAAVRRTVIEQGLGRAEGGRELARIMREHFDRSPDYWQLVAGAAAVRGRSFGNIESFVQAGAKTYRFVAMMDYLTSRTCQHLNGKVWTVKAAVELRDRMIAATDPGAIKDAHPWLPEKTVLGMDDAALAARGVIFPPVHGHCRSTLVVEEFEGGRPGSGGGGGKPPKGRARRIPVTQIPSATARVSG